MRLYIGPRATGKTAMLIRLCEESPGTVIVAPNKTSAENIEMLALELGKTIPEPITFRQFVDGRRNGTKITGFLFDDLDRALQIAAGVDGEALAATMTLNEVVRPEGRNNENNNV